MTKKQRIITLIIIFLVLGFVAISSEYSSMSIHLGFWEELGALVLLTAIIWGIIQWVKKSKKGQ